jgi:hypothetical protein
MYANPLQDGKKNDDGMLVISVTVKLQYQNLGTILDILLYKIDTKACHVY